MLKKLTWQERVTKLVEYNEKHELSCRELAYEFNFSKSQVNADLNLGYALRVFSELERIDNYVKALAFIKQKKFHRKID